MNTLKTCIESTDRGRATAAPAAPISLDRCREFLAQAERAKAALFKAFRPQIAPHEHLLWLALNEAEALAWQTDYPHLLFPTLAAEKAETVTAWHAQQAAVQRKPVWLPLAA